MPANLVWLASYPKSGNTWLRLFLATYLNDAREVEFDQIARLIPSEASLGFFRRLGLEDTNNLGETYKLRPVVQHEVSKATKVVRLLKTHLAHTTVRGFPTISTSVTARSVYIVRNPFDVAVSIAKFSDTTNAEAIRDMKDASAHLAASEAEAHQFLGSWANHVRAWMTHTETPVLRVRYEDMLSKPHEEFSRILSFLRITPEPAKVADTIALVSFTKLAERERAQGFPERPKGVAKFFQSGTAYSFLSTLSEDEIAEIWRAFRPIINLVYPEIES